MAKFYGDIASAISGLLGGFNYDQKLTVTSKTSNGVGLTGNAVKKGEGVSGDVKAVYNICHGASADVVFNDKGKLTASVAMTEVAPGLKATVSSPLPDLGSAKVALQYVKGALGIKGDIGFSKIEGNTCYNAGSYAIGTEFGFDSNKGALSKLGVGFVYKASDYTTSFLFTDKLDTLKLGYVKPMDNDRTMGAEIVHKMTPGTSTLTLACAQKLETGTAKATLDSKGFVSLQYSQPLASNATVTFCTQFDTTALDKNAKLGLQLKVAA